MADDTEPDRKPLPDTRGLTDTVQPCISPFPPGLCQCGCGKPTNLAKATNGAWGHVKGQPVRFLLGHGGSPKQRVIDVGDLAAAELRVLLASKTIRRITAACEARRYTGRAGYPPRSMVAMVLLKQASGLPWSAVAALVANDDELCDAVGCAPSQWACYRFERSLCDAAPPKLCECGCGHPAPIATETDLRQGKRKGHPQRFILGHTQRRHSLAEHRACWTDAGIEYGLCLCGCGERTAIAVETQVARGMYRGEPRKCIAYHRPGREAARAVRANQHEQAKAARAAKRAVGKARSHSAEIRESARRPARLDTPLANGGGSWGDLVAAKPGLDDPQRYIEHKERDEILGDLCVEDLAGMDEHSLQRLRTRLMEAGYASSGVQAKERERLRVPTPHRGDAPPPKTGKKSTGRRGRNEASEMHRATGKRFNRRKDERRERDANRARKIAN